METSNINPTDIISVRDQRVIKNALAEAYSIANEAIQHDPRMASSPIVNSRRGQNIYMNASDFLFDCSKKGELEGEVVWQPSATGGVPHVEYIRNEYRVTLSRVKSDLDPPRKAGYRYEAALSNQDEMVGLGLNFRSIYSDEEIPQGHTFKDFCITHGTDELSMIRLVLPGVDENDKVISLWRGENWIDQSFGLPPIALEEPMKLIEPQFKAHLVETAIKKLHAEDGQ